MVLDSLFKRSGAQVRESQENREPAERVLPSDIRFALQYREARLTNENILDLNRNGFENEALYLLMKATESDPKQQLQFMSDLVGELTQKEGREGVVSASLKDQVKNFLNHAITQLPQDTIVLGGKLAQLSRQGFEHWENLYVQAAERHARSTASTFLVGHATFIGLASFIDSHTKAGKPLQILIPPFINDPSSDICGYRIQDQSVQTLKKDFPRDLPAVVIDDTRKTGNSSKNIERFWTARGAYQPPHLEFLSLTDPDVHF